MEEEIDNKLKVKQATKVHLYAVAAIKSEIVYQKKMLDAYASQ